MDNLHRLQREHEAVLSIWKLMRENGSKETDWDWLQDECSKLSEKYKDMSFVDDWLIAYMKYKEK